MIQKFIIQQAKKNEPNTASLHGTDQDGSAENTRDWKSAVRRFQKPCLSRAAWQMANTFIPFAISWELMFAMLPHSVWLAIPFLFLTSGLVVRTFVIFHDCGHGSFFPSKRMNNLLGFVTGVMTFTPYAHWRWEHSIHHSASGNLDARGFGDVWTMTVREFQLATPWQRLKYRSARNPLVMFILNPSWLFLIRQRFSHSKAPPSARRSVWYTNLGILGVAALMSYQHGIWAYAIIQGLVVMISGAAGVWLFYVQHQFENTYWEHDTQWEYPQAALVGSSYYKLPKWLQWFSGNIGFHHIHHLSSKIPNYNLESCHQSSAMFKAVPTLTLMSSLRALSLRLWDEERYRLVGYEASRAYPNATSENNSKK